MLASPTSQEFWQEYNYGIFAQKILDSIFRSRNNKWKNHLQEKKIVKFCSKMPLGPTGHDFFQEYNGGVFAWKLVDCIYSGPENKWKNILQEKKNQLNIVRKYPPRS